MPTSPAGVHIAVTVILFCVSVPVLSEQIYVAAPSVSTAGSRLMTALLFAIFCTPSERTTVTTAGRPSGIAATARLTESMNALSMPMPRRMLKTNISAQMASAPMPSALPIFASFICRGVVGSSSSLSRCAIRPTAVSMPVCVTMAVARPAVMTVDEKTIFFISACALPAGTENAASFSQGRDSPVSALSCASSDCDFTSRASAGTRSPAQSFIRSPRTTSAAGTVCSLPPRTTQAVGADMLLSASRECSARLC